MRIFVVILGLVSSVPLSVDANDDDLKQMQGMWILESQTINGKPFPGNVGTMKITVSGSTLTMLRKDKDQTVLIKYKFTIDATKKPKTTDWVSEEGPNKGSAYSNIYSLDATTLRFASGGKQRPTSFDTASAVGNNQMILVFKREKK